MSAKKRGGEQKPTAIVIDGSDDLKGVLKSLGGSQSDHWNNLLANQTVQTLWLAQSDKDTRDRQYSATVAALVGIGPKDEIEGMIAAQLLAAHNAAMECYRRAMIGEQTFEGRRENLGMRGLGVLWGYGTRDELESAGADQLVESTVDLACTVLAMVSGKRPST